MSATTPAQTRRKLSPVRVGIAVLVTAAVVVGGVFAAKNWYTDAVAAPIEGDPWFASYVDVTATPSYAFETPVSSAAKNVVLSFIVADTDDACTPTWGTAYTLDEASTALDLDRRIARLGQVGGEAIVSFGGAINDELATVCTDPTKLVDAYASVVDRYDLSTIDLDLEGPTLSAASAERRATAIATLQASRAKTGNPLAVWLTLPVTPDGLSPEGTDAVAAYLAAGVDLAGVNVMTMDYGGSRADDQSMLDASTSALTNTHRQLGILYGQADIDLTNATLWSKIGATPMIGQNDVAAEVFTTADATGLNAFARDNGVGRMSMWSLNRDATCGPNYADTTLVSDACSGVDQGETSFASVLGKKMTGAPQANVTETTPEALPAQAEDDPATSPYAIWLDDATYLAGTKVVWHRNVYEAKWWTSGDLPDDPVLDLNSTPWKLIGPVLPGEKPVPVPTLPAGTYKDWSGKSVYEKGDRILFEGLAFEAKWWTQGDSPEASSTEPDASPWVALTVEQLNAVIDGK